MQARVEWSPPSGALGRLVAAARRRAEALSAASTGEKAREGPLPPAGGFENAVRSAGGVAVIAELKRRSPSKGDLNAHLSAGLRAREYAAGGASALSVLTEPSEFGGSNADLDEAGAATGLPILRKDFLVSPAQLGEARAIGASAALLIVRALGPDGTRVMADAAREGALEVVFEVRDEGELKWALDAGARMVGVNRRNLETLAMEDAVPRLLIPAIPPALVVIAESGITDRSGVEEMAALGADAVLVGSSLSRAADGAAAVRALTAVPRRGRRG